MYLYKKSLLGTLVLLSLLHSSAYADNLFPNGGEKVYHENTLLEGFIKPSNSGAPLSITMQEGNLTIVNDSFNETLLANFNDINIAGNKNNLFTLNASKNAIALSVGESDKNITIDDFDSVFITHTANTQQVALAREGTINIAAEETVRIEGKTHVVAATDNGTININAANVNLISNSDGQSSVVLGGGTGDIKGGTVNIGSIDDAADTVSLTVESEKSTAIETRNEGNVNIYGRTVAITGDVAAKSGKIVIDNLANASEKTSNSGSSISGDILAVNGGDVDVNLKAGSVWTGRGDNYFDFAGKNAVGGYYRPDYLSSITSSGSVNVALGENSTWNVTGQSWLNNFQAVNASINYEGAKAVTIGKMTGSGAFNMQLDNDNRLASDMLYIKEGDAEINVSVNGVINGLDKVSKENGLRFATVGKDIVLNGFKYQGEDLEVPENGTVIIKNSDGGVFNTNLYVERQEYKKDDVYNAEYNGDKLDENKPGVDNVNDFFGDTEADNLVIVKAEKDDTSDAGKTIVSMSRINYSNAVYMDRLNKRLGEARYIDGDEGMWVRLRHDRIGKDKAFRSMNTMYEIGYDKKQENDGGERRLGFAFDYMRGSAEYSGISGSGEVKRAGLWAYDTWLGDKGHYADYVAKWGHLSNDFDITAKSTGEKISGDYANNVFSVSAEYGRKKDIGHNWYVEPQTQIQYAHVTSADYKTSQGTAVELDGIDSLIARAGLRLGKDYGVEKRGTIYLKFDVLHEFLGDQDIYAKDGTGVLSRTYSNQGTWYDAGFGFAAQMDEDSYWYMDFEKSFGNDNEDTYQINAGIQWTF